ncbi:sensor histidine kinase [Streptomyces purpurogeneiscleroticus]|uniref:sensor histidine kinase n=1 Tax=Streptomyces purpurogeneiscleroticus TaxID=68259 RepID=UPI001CBC056B|nr:sensor histidine kinase [Streptomyces purpurogeneiscleroticus]
MPHVLQLPRLYDLLLWSAVAAPPAVALFRFPPGQPLFVACAAVPLLAVAVLLSRRRPLVALGIPVALGLAQSVELLSPLYWPALAAFAYLAGRRTAEIRAALWFFAAVAVAGLPLCTIIGHDLWGWPQMLLVLLPCAALPWLLGRLRRQYAELVGSGWRLADRMEREQQAVADRARIRERARIAGDMHDSLGHELTLLAVRAGALEVDPSLDARHRAAVGELRAAAGAATERLREIIGVLRADDEQAPVVPSEETVEALVERARQSGVDIRLVRTGAADGLPPMVGPAVHRVVQEALTNAAKHAPGGAVRVRIDRADGVLSVAVVNEPAAVGAPPPGVASGGAGLVGLDERVRLAGGTLRTGPTPEGGFEVAAELPTGAGAGSADLPAGAGAAARGAGAGSGAHPSTSARELERARLQVRRRLTQTVVVPLAALAGILLLMLPVSLLSSSFSVLDRAAYDRLRVGQEERAVEDRLPVFTRDGPPDDTPPAPHGQRCAYYSTGVLASDAYRLCFADGRLAGKSVVGAKE